MNIYFLVEGKSTERKVYPAWLAHLLPDLKRVSNYNDVVNNNYYLFSANGYPSIIYEHLPNAIADINDNGNYNYLVLCLDAEEVTVEYRKQEINDLLITDNYTLTNAQIVIIVQNRCFETWCLGNKKIYTKNPSDNPLLTYTRYYDVSANCPELMGKYPDFSTHAQFHEDYLIELFRAKKISYSKSNPGDVLKLYYLQELMKRVQNDPTHLLSFQSFIQFCNIIKSKI
ncbi:hypothetical protein [Anabaena azotica]|uniref:DUF4276 family protein n=1 Tax=Anabaena azotica FACHB-119 TaxID=947527 RepID=A0ABR8D2E0_9NOST|nr:hypothetical protein [Anabaena azotica]MBD2500884.1 hypothetical protein [Anabaena azotica FACHB-119]